MSLLATGGSVGRRLRLGIVGIGVAVAALSVAVVADPDVLTATTRRAVGATAAAYGTTPEVAFVTLHAPLLFGVVMGAVGSVFVGRVLSETAVGDAGTLGTVLRLSAEASVLATGVALGVPLIIVSGDAFPVTLLLAFVAGLPVGVLALCGAVVGGALATRTEWPGTTLLGTAGPVAGVVLAHAAPTGPVWTVSAGATFTALALVGGGWSALRRR